MLFPSALAVVRPLARNHMRALTVAASAAVLQVGVDLAQPWPLAFAVDHAIERRPSTGVLAPLNGLSPGFLLLLAGAVTIGLSLLGGLLDYTSTLASERAAEKIGAELRRSVFARALRLSLRWHDRTGSGELLSRLGTDVGRVLDALVAVFATLLPDLVLLVGVLIILLTLDPGLVLVGLSVLPILAVLSVRQRRRVRGAEQQARQHAGRLSGLTADLLRNVRVVQAFGRADRAESLYDQRNQALLSAELQAAGTAARWSPTADVVLAIGTGCVLVIGGERVLSGGLSTGALLVVLAYLRNLYSPVRGLTRLASVLAKSSVSGTRLQEVLTCNEGIRDCPEALPAPNHPTPISFEQVTFGYDGPRDPILRGFDLNVSAGESVCLLGPSGTGKTTLLHLLLRLYDVDEGRVLLGGIDLRMFSLTSLRHQVAFVPQDPWLLDATLAENIALGAANPSRADVLAAGRTAMVDEFAGRLPNGYDTVLGESGVRLSGGQRRRVALARAVLSTAPVVLLDEPTASLDAASAHTVIRAITTATAGRTVLMVTHDPDLAAIADRVVHVDHDVLTAGSRQSLALTGRR